jgi:hypothetical protein
VRQAVEETVLQHAVWLGEPWEMDIWLVVWNMAFIFQFIYGYGFIYIWDNQSFPLTNSYFSEG